MRVRFNRRQILLCGAALPLSRMAISHSETSKPPSQPLTLPPSGFNQDSTAEEVTAGLDLSGKTILITGCNAGIGYETMRVLVLRGALVYGLARNMEKATEACSSVQGKGIKGSAIPFACEQTDFSSVVACSESVRKRGSPIDVLICNAGVYLVPQLQLAEGLELQFVVNHLSHFLLVNRLLDRVKSAKQGRVVVVGSESYAQAPEGGIDFDNLSGQKGYDSDQMYGQSKLANGLFARELARKLSRTRTTSNVLSPGWVMTKKNVELLTQKIPNFDPNHTRGTKTPEQGAATTCYVSTSPSLAKVSGQYFSDCNLLIPKGYMRDDALAAKLWTVSEQLTRAYLK